MTTRPPRTHRGSALLLAIIMLLVLAAIATATIALSTQERTNAAAKAKTDFLAACANAAQAKIWAEMGQYGMGYLGSAVQVTRVTLPDGTILAAPAHQRDDDPTTAVVKDVVFSHQLQGTTGDMSERDCTNRDCSGGGLGATYEMTAVCTDAAGRKQELELSVKFAL